MSNESGLFPASLFKFPDFWGSHPGTHVFAKTWQRNVDVLSEINGILYASLSSIARRQSDLWQHEANDIFKIFTSILSAPASIEDHAVFCAEASKESLDKRLDNIRGIATELNQAQEKASNILGSCIREGVDEWHNVIKLRQKKVA